MSEKSGGTNNCDQCHAPLVQGALCCTQCGKLQGATKNCIRCDSLIPSKANFCPHCTCNQTVQEKKCTLCSSVLRSDAQYCYLCSYPQDPNVHGSIPLKKCIEPSCPALLLHHLPVCYKCQKPQATSPSKFNYEWRNAATRISDPTISSYSWIWNSVREDKQG